MVTVLINFTILLLIALAMAVPLVVFVRYTRPDEPWGNRELGLFFEGLRVGERRDGTRD